MHQADDHGFAAPGATGDEPPAPDPPSPPPGRGSAAPPAVDVATTGYASPRGLATVLQVIFGWWLLVSALGILVLANDRVVFSRYNDGRADVADLVAAADLIAAHSVLVLVTLVATMGVFIAWFHRCYSNLAALGPRRPSRSPGAAVGWWFVPFANWVVPHQIAQEIWTGSRPRGERAERSDLISAWWVAFVVQTGVFRVIRAAMIVSTRNDLDAGYEQLSTLDMVHAGVTGVSALLALSVVRVVTARQEHRNAARIAADAESYAALPIA